MTYEIAVGIIGAVACVGLMAAAVRAKLGWINGAVMCVLALVLCQLGARGLYVLVCELPGGGYMGPWLAQEPYVYAFGGGVLGFVAALWVMRLRRPVREVSEAFVPVGMLAVCLLRLAEALSDFGWGDMLENTLFQRYPFAIENMYGEWCAAVFNLEALCALVILAALLCRPGRRLETALVWWAVTQIFCESLRVESIQWGFVRVQQLLSVIIVAAVMLSTGRRAASVKAWIVYAACIGVIIFIEYALDKLPFPIWLDYAVMACAVGVMGVNAQRMVGRKTA